MSLPTTAIIYNAQGVEIDRQFCNCGWFIDPKAIASMLLHQIVNKGFVETDVVSVYSLRIPVKLLLESTDAKDLATKLEDPVKELYKKVKDDIAQSD